MFGRDAGPFVGKKPTGSAHAALHLVKDQQRPGGIANRAQLAQISVRRRANAAFALDRFDDHGGGGWRDRAVQRGALAKRQVGEPRQQRAKAPRQLVAARRRDASA